MIINDSKIELTNAEALKAIKKLKNLKSPGSDGIRNELLKYGGEILAQKINMLFNKILDNHQIPQRESVFRPHYLKRAISQIPKITEASIYLIALSNF
jgi:hypothetical protein